MIVCYKQLKASMNLYQWLDTNEAWKIKSGELHSSVLTFGEMWGSEA